MTVKAMYADEHLPGQYVVRMMDDSYASFRCTPQREIGEEDLTKLARTYHPDDELRLRSTGYDGWVIRGYGITLADPEDMEFFDEFQAFLWWPKPVD